MSGRERARGANATFAGAVQEQPARHRPDIDGLRAVAVTSVVLFHAGFSIFRGGFVGVDVFFVISGYLIGGQILKAALGGGFSFADFYTRRAKRILPALFVVLLAICALGWVLLSAEEYRHVGATAMSALFATSNFSFWRYQDYFAPDSREQPLLMTWSLGVEEQFYLLFPFVVFAIVKWAPRRAALGFALLSLASLLYGVWCTKTQPIAAFYLLPSRAWELGVGATLAALERDRKGKDGRPRSGPFIADARLRELVGFLGLIAVGGSIVTLKSTDPFPGVLALIPVLGSAALIAAEGSGINSICLSFPAATFIGLVSYSWYLWHWPLMSFVRLAAADEPSPLIMGGVGLLAFIMAILSWRFVEQPLRRWKIPSFHTLAGYVAALLVLAGVMALIRIEHGFPKRLTSAAARIEADISAGRGNCLAEWRVSSPDTSSACSVSVSGRPAIAVIGDSHAAALGPGLRAIAGEGRLGLGIYTKSACPPMIGVSVTRANMPFFADACADFMRTSFSAAAKRADVATVVIAADWGAYKALSPTAFQTGLRRGVEVLTGAGKRVILARDVPGWQIYPTHVALGSTIPPRGRLLELLWSGKNRMPAMQGWSEGVAPEDTAIDGLLAAVATETKATNADLRAPFCTAGCQFADQGHLLFIDRDHLSHWGSDRAVRALNLDGKSP